MKVAITGASGFVGGAMLQELLREGGHEIVAWAHDDEPVGYPIMTVRGSLEDLTACERLIVRHRPDVVYHLGAQAIVGHAKSDPLGTMETNVRGTYNLLEAFRRHRKPDAVMVIASSDKAYGETRVYANGLAPYEEGDPLEGRGPYDVSKSCADLIAQSYSHTYGIPIAIVRAGNVYGPGDRDTTRIVPSIVADLKARRRPIIMSDGTPVRDYLYIQDAILGYIAVARYLSSVGSALAQPAFNLAGGEPVSVIELVRAMINISGYTDLNPIITGERKREIQHQVLDISRAKLMLGWEPHVSLHEGLTRTLRSVGLAVR